MEDGFYNGVICGARVVDNRFGKEGKEIEFSVGILDNSGLAVGKVEIYLEYSNRFGMGNMSQMRQWQIAENDMRRLGWQGNGDFTRLGELVNTKCRVNYKTKDKEGKPYSEPRAYFAFNEVKAVEGNVNAIMAAIRNGGGAVFGAPAAPAPASAPGAFNFAQPAAPAPVNAGAFGAPAFPS